MSSAPEKNRLQREIWGVVICLVALLITLSLLSYDPATDHSTLHPAPSILITGAASSAHFSPISCYKASA